CLEGDMERTCDKCGTSYDDAERSTVCPHYLLMPATDRQRKHAALALLGRQVRFADQPQGPHHRIQSVAWDGMVTLADLPGQFAPEVFVIVGRSNAATVLQG